MEKRSQRSSSGEIFSFPSTPIQESSDFEFDSFTPDSPSLDPYKDSPADHLFFNGRLLPHAFPLPPAKWSSSCGTSRTSSVSSKDSLSLMSSRSNSTNSRSSSCSSSARTSWSDGSDRRLLYHYRSRNRAYKAMGASKMVTVQLYGDSQRWQYITPVVSPGLKREGSRRKNNNNGVAKKQGSDREKGGGRQAGPWRKILRSFLLVCRECHAMEPSPSREEDALQRSFSLR
ncbi:hypothetical protein SLE2022_393530 [Rubroshorea leprosula]